MTSIKREYFQLTAHQRPSVGDTKLSALGIDHMGWLICDGRTLNIKDYVFLFNVIGFAYGGSAATQQFQLPNPAGRVPGVIGSGVGLTTRAMGDTVGEETHTLTINEMPAHKHGSADVTGNTNGDGYTTSNATGITLNDPGHSHTLPLSSAALTGVGPSDDVTQGSGYNTGSNTTGITLTDPQHRHQMGSTGGGAAHNNMQPTLFMGNMFIYCGKPNTGNYPLTAGYYGVIPNNTIYSNVL